MTISMAARREHLRLEAMRSRWVSLHVSDPDGIGAHEVSGQFYQRQPVAWDSTFRNTHEVRFVLPDVTVTHVGYWDAEVSGGFRNGEALPRETRTDEGDSGRFAPGALSLDVGD